MTKLDRLIAELCPDGVENKMVGAICDITRGRVMSKDYLRDNTGDYPVYSSQTTNNGIFGYIDNYDYDCESITWTTDGANAGSVFYHIGEKFSITNVCGLLIAKDSMEISMRFVFYALAISAKRYVNDGMGNPKLMSNVMARVIIPFPPLPIQREIVRILDNFLELADALKAESKARKKQYEYYRNELLTLSDYVPMMPLGDVAEYRRGSFPQPYGNREWYNGEGAMPFVQVADIAEVGMRLVEKTKQQISTYAQPMSVFVPKGTVVVSLQGSIGRVAITQYDSYVDRTLAIFYKYKIKISKKYFAYQIERKFGIEKEFARGSTLKTITKEEFTRFTIPVPSLDEQNRIVRILDCFDMLANDKTSGLPSEIEARIKQYEYYRDKLLTL